jgi:hypothetical protein
VRALAGLDPPKVTAETRAIQKAASRGELRRARFEVEVLEERVAELEAKAGLVRTANAADPMPASVLQRVGWLRQYEATLIGVIRQVARVADLEAEHTSRKCSHACTAHPDTTGEALAEAEQELAHILNSAALRGAELATQKAQSR